MEGEPVGRDTLQQQFPHTDDGLGKSVGERIVVQGLALQEITGISDDIKELELALAERVQSLIAQGVTWKVIGAALGISKQTAHQRYKPDQ